MIDLSLLPDGGMSWLDASGPKATIVLSTRIRLARNVRGIVFSQRAKDGDRTAVLQRVSEAAAASERLVISVGADSAADTARGKRSGFELSTIQPAPDSRTIRATSDPGLTAAITGSP